MFRLIAIAVAAGLLVPIASRDAYAGVGFGSLGIDPSSLISQDVVKSLTELVAFGTQHRPYEPATPLGVVVGVDVSLELTLFKIPDSLFTSMSASGAPASSPLPAAPIAKLHLHKGLGDFVDVGGSLFWYPSNWIVGGDLKIVFLQGEEGPTFAFRICYTYTDLNFSGISMNTHTYSPQLLLSRQIEFADPYIGIAAEYATGSLDATIPTSAFFSGPIPPGVPSSIDFPVKSPAAWGGYAFGGVSLRVPRSGLRVTLEGSYNTAGTSTMGTKVGFTF